MKKLVKKLVALVCLCVAFVATPVFADLEKGLEAYLAGDYKTALAELILPAEQGDTTAQVILGKMYEEGQGVPQNYEVAVKLYKLSAEHGNNRAQFELGLLYTKGEGVSQDYKQAVKWYTLSAEQGYAQAQTKLGAIYVVGRGVFQDYVRAHMWFNLAASNDFEDGVELRNELAKIMTPAQIEKAQVLAQECIAKNYKGC